MYNTKFNEYADSISKTADGVRNLQYNSIRQSEKINSNTDSISSVSNTLREFTLGWFTTHRPRDISAPRGANPPTLVSPYKDHHITVSTVSSSSHPPLATKFCWCSGFWPGPCCG